jgi:predicted amidophosphoribosyltransferase
VSLIAQPKSLTFGKVFLPNTLLGARETILKVELSTEARHVNVHVAFRADRKRIQSRSVLLVDGVATTGAAFSTGASDVYVLTIERALLQHGLMSI